MKSVMFGGDNNTSGDTTPSYRQWNTTISGAWSVTEVQRITPISEDVTVTSFTFTLDTAPGVGKSYTFTLRDDAVDTAVSIVISDLNTTGSWTGSVLFAAGSSCSIKATPSGTPANFTISTWVIDYDTTGQSFIMPSGSNTAPSVSATNYMTAGGGSQSTWVTAATGNFEIIIPSSGTLTAFTAVAEGSPGSGKSYAVSVRQNNTTDIMTATISNLATSATATGSVALAAGDTIVIKCVPSGTPTARRITYCMSISPTTNGEVFFGFGSAALPSTTATNYEQVHGVGSEAWAGSEIQRYERMPAYLVKNLYWSIGTAPGASKSRTLTFRDSVTNTALTSTITGTATTGNNTTNSFTPTNTVSNTIAAIPSGTPAAATGGIHGGYVVVVPQPSSTASGDFFMMF